MRGVQIVVPTLRASKVDGESTLEITSRGGECSSHDSHDYMCMGQDDGKITPILAIEDKKSKTPWCYAVPAKGVQEYAVACCMEAVRETGYRRLIFKSDDEHAIVALKMQVIRTLTDVEIVP